MSRSGTHLEYLDYRAQTKVMVELRKTGANNTRFWQTGNYLSGRGGTGIAHGQHRQRERLTTVTRVGRKQQSVSSIFTEDNHSRNQSQLRAKKQVEAAFKFLRPISQ